MDLRLKGLIELYEFFQSIGSTVFLSSGTMLGAVRDHDFIPWDWNVALGIIDYDIKNKISRTIEWLNQNKFTGHITKKGKYYGFRLNRDGIVFIVENIIQIGKWMTRPNHKGPAKFFNTFEKVKLQNYYFYCATPTKEVMEFHYGKNWRIPIKAGHRNEVITADHFIHKSDGINNKKLRRPVTIIQIQ
jgi:hypothetical protein